MSDNYILDENHEVVEIPVFIDVEPGDPVPEGYKRFSNPGHYFSEAKLIEWGRWMEESNNRIVKQEHVGPYWVSTVFLALDHNFNPDSAPLLFETMVFDEEHKVKVFNREVREEAGVQERYSNWTQAEEGHARIVQQMREWLERSSAEVEEHFTEEEPHPCPPKLEK